MEVLILVLVEDGLRVILMSLLDLTRKLLS